MNTKLLFAFIISLSGFTCKGQQDSFALKKNAIYFELAGNGIVYTINYEHVFLQKNQTHLCWRIGIGALPFFGETIPFIPAEINLLTGKKKNFLEIGFGHTFSTLTMPSGSGKHTQFSFLRLGYHFQGQDRGFLFRIAPMLMYEHSLAFFSHRLHPFAGVSVGKTF